MRYLLPLFLIPSILFAQGMGGGGKRGLSTAGGTMSGAIDMGGYKVTNSTTPSAATDLATKGYVDANSGGGGGSYLPLTGGTIDADEEHKEFPVTVNTSMDTDAYVRHVNANQEGSSNFQAGTGTSSIVMAYLNSAYPELAALFKPSQGMLYTESDATNGLVITTLAGPLTLAQGGLLEENRRLILNTDGTISLLGTTTVTGELLVGDQLVVLDNDERLVGGPFLSTSGGTIDGDLTVTGNVTTFSLVVQEMESNSTNNGIPIANEQGKLTVDWANFSYDPVGTGNGPILSAPNFRLWNGVPGQVAYIDDSYTITGSSGFTTDGSNLSVSGTVTASRFSLPSSQSVVVCFYQNTTDSTTITDNSPTSFDVVGEPITDDDLNVTGSTIVVDASGIYSDGAAPGTNTFSVLIGSTAFTFPALSLTALQDNQPWAIHAIISTRDTGENGTARWSGTASVGVSGVMTTMMAGGTVEAVNWTAKPTIAIQNNFSATGNSAILQNLTLTKTH